MKWSPEFSVGIEEIDSQHKYLFKLISIFQQAIINQSSVELLANMLDALLEYAENHFRTEEHYFADHPESELHLQIHQAFVEQIRQFEKDVRAGKTNLDEDLTTFLENWLTNHIIHTDRRHLAS